MDNWIISQSIIFTFKLSRYGNNAQKRGNQWYQHYCCYFNLAKSRGKSVALMLLLTLIFSWIVTLILAFMPKVEKEVRG